MRMKVRVSFDGREIAGGERVLLEAARCGPDVASVSDVEVLRQTFVRVDLYADDPRLAILLELLQEHGVEWREWPRDEYTDAEFDAAPLLLLTNSADEYRIFGGPRLGTEYDLSAACPVCAAGARQMSALMVDGADPADIRKVESDHHALTCYRETIVDERLAEALASAGLSGLSFRGVYAVQEDGQRAELPWRQLWAEHTMPPLSPRTTGIDARRVCASCGRSRFYTMSKEPTRLAYRARDLAFAQDVNRTWECFGDLTWTGDLKTAVLPFPYFLVTPKVRRIFLDAGVTDFNWIPIRVVDE